MGLDTSHDAFHGAYSAFNKFRQCVCAAMGGDSSYPPHWEYNDDGSLTEPVFTDPEKDPNLVYIGAEYTRATHPGLYEFLTHSDCDGEISPEMCERVADDLEALLPKIEALGWEAHGHIAARGGFVEVTRKFIAGCRAAARECQPLVFR